MARQKLGQHFLQSSKALDRIIHALRAGSGAEQELAVEIGPGKGALTEYLLREFPRVIAVELDRELVPELRERWSPEQGLTVIEANALQVDWAQFGSGVLAGNLPYYVSTALISQYLRNPGALTQAVFLIQKEVAERITAKPGTREYSYFSVECQYLSAAEYLFGVPPGAFRPPPKVDSAVVRLAPNNSDAPEAVASFLEFASHCFRQKRKTLRNNLAGLYECNGDGALSMRAEQLSVSDLLALHGSLIRRTR